MLPLSYALLRVLAKTRPPHPDAPLLLRLLFHRQLCVSPESSEA